MIIEISIFLEKVLKLKWLQCEQNRGMRMIDTEQFNLMLSEDLRNDAKLYRYMKLSKFIEFVERKRTYFTSIYSWEDRWEAPWDKISNQKDGTLYCDVKKRMDNMIGQCWSFEGVSDALWKIYSDYGEGIMIEATVQSFLKIKGIKEAMIAPVIYYDDIDKVVKRIENIKPYNTIYGYGFLKRKAFEYEKEVRIITINEHETADKVKNDQFHAEFELDPIEFIQNIIIDPRAEDWFVDTMKRYCKRAGFKIEPIKSDLLLQDNVR